ncbi:MAG TPA: uracil-DNA glycosylase family protein [Patescibacteria group bacterium]|nr:uracil-DNA glycosylase family protein [Patescibacteria group bacterium]
MRRTSPFDSQIAASLLQVAANLKQTLSTLRFSPPVSHVYNPLEYAWPCYEAYISRFAATAKRVVFLGMNPGPFGMVQTGVPFGEVKAVRNWLQLQAKIGRPPHQHPRRPITGLECRRSEVSGQRLWGLFAERFGPAQEFFRDHLVLNYCPLAFMEASGRNRTPDKLPVAEKERLFAACDEHLKAAIETLQPQWVIGVGDFARRRAELVFQGTPLQLGQILHPSPANPQANRAWAAVVTRQLIELGVWRG